MTKLNFLHINKFHYLRGGSEAVYFMTARLLEDYGHHSIFFSMHHPENVFCKTSDYFVPYIDLTRGEGVISQLKIAGRVIYCLEAKRRLSKLLDNYPVDIAHLHNIYHQISPSIIHELKKRKIPIVMTLHDYKMVCASYNMLVHGRPCEDCTGGRYFKAIKNRCVKSSLAKSLLCALEMYSHHKLLNIYDNVDIFISPSLFLKNKLEEAGFKKGIVYLPNFIDIRKFEKFKVDIKGNKEKKENSLVYFGRFSPEKGLFTLLKAAKHISDKSRNIEIKIIGDGPIKEQLLEKVKAEKINNVRFLEYMRGEALYQEIRKSLVAVLPSEWYENNPMSVIEAFAIGIPVIGARIGGIPELINNETGLTFKPGDSNDLSSKIEYLVNNPDKAVKMGENARAYVKQELNSEKYYKKLMEIYKQLI